MDKTVCSENGQIQVYILILLSLNCVTFTGIASFKISLMIYGNYSPGKWMENIQNTWATITINLLAISQQVPPPYVCSMPAAFLN